MAVIKLDDTTAGRTYVAKITRDSDGYMWNGVSEFVAENTLTDAQQATAVGLATTTAVVSGTGTHSHYIFTVPAGITVPCHIGIYLTSYAVNDKEAYWADYDTKTGFSLAATGLDAITATEPTGKPTTFPGWVMWLIQRARSSSKSTTQILVKTEAGATVTTQAITDDGAGAETLGPPA